MSEFYYDERPGTPHAQWGSPGGTGGMPGGSWGSGSSGTSGGGTTPPVWEEDEKDIASFLRLDDRGFLRLDEPDFLLGGTRSCLLAPEIIVFLQEEARFHMRCILLRLGENTLSLQSASNYSFARFEPAPGSYEISARWQAGHYDYAEISAARILICGVDLGTVTLPLSRRIRIAKIDILEDLTIYVNDIRGSLGGNLRFLN